MTGGSTLPPYLIYSIDSFLNEIPLSRREKNATARDIRQLFYETYFEKFNITEPPPKKDQVLIDFIRSSKFQWRWFYRRHAFRFKVTRPIKEKKYPGDKFAEAADFFIVRTATCIEDAYLLRSIIHAVLINLHNESSRTDEMEEGILRILKTNFRDCQITFNRAKNYSCDSFSWHDYSTGSDLPIKEAVLAKIATMETQLSKTKRRGLMQFSLAFFKQSFRDRPKGVEVFVEHVVPNVATLVNSKNMQKELLKQLERDGEFEESALEEDESIIAPFIAKASQIEVRKTVSCAVDSGHEQNINIPNKVPGTKAPQVDQTLLITANKDKILQWIVDLHEPSKREESLQELSKNRVPELAIWLWHSFGTMSILIMEIIDIYPSLKPERLTLLQTNRVCNVLALLQCVAGHKETCKAFLEARIINYIFPLLCTAKASKSYEYLRLTSLGVFGAMVKTHTKDIIDFLLTTEIMPICLHIMKHSTELSQTVATFIIHKILSSNCGLEYVCENYNRFCELAGTLYKMVKMLTKTPSMHILKHAILCYVRLVDNSKAVEAFKRSFPTPLTDETFKEQLALEESSKYYLIYVLAKLDRPIASFLLEK